MSNLGKSVDVLMYRLVYEHVASSHAPVKAWQGAYYAILGDTQAKLTIFGLAVNNSVWSYLLDGCDLVHNTEKTLANAFEWESVELGPGTYCIKLAVFVEDES